MLKINRKIEYALIALRHMSDKRPGELTTVKEICAAHKAPFDVVSRVLQILTQHGILKSEHGARGGYLIQKDLAKISLLKLTELLLGPIRLADCIHDNEGNCNLSGNCNIAAPIARLNDRVKSFYGAIAVGDLILPAEGKKTRAAGPAESFVV